MKKQWRIALIVVAIVCFGVALYYPISEYLQKKQSEESLDLLAAMRNAGLESLSEDDELEEEDPEEPVTDAPEPEPTETPEPEPTDAPTVKAEPEKAAATEQPAHAGAQQDAEAPAPDLNVVVPEASATEAPTQKNESQTAAPAPANPTEKALATATKAPAATASSNAAEAPTGQETETPSATPTEQETPRAKPQETSVPAATSKPESGTEEPAAPASDAPTPEPTAEPTEAPTPIPEPTAEPTATPDRRVNSGPKTWDELEKVPLDESKILKQYRELYKTNNDMVGWMTIPGTKIDYPVMQREDEDYYLSHDFFHKENINGLLILDSNCDPYTPSYNLVVSGHNRKNGTIFSNLTEYYNNWRNWSAHKIIQFDSLMEQRTYVVFAAFFAADYAANEEGFRYNANIRYRVDATQWLSEVRAYQLYDTEIDVEFGDEFLTLTTCNSSKRKNGRFVVVARRVREGEVIK